MSFWSELRGRNVHHEGAKFGIELEVEGVDSDDVPDELRDYCNVTSDGSLRNGIELVTSPLTLDQVRSFAPLYTVWASESVTLSERCSTHIHVNVQDMTEDQFKAFLWLCIAIEPALMSTVSEFRQNNVYCYPVYKTGNLVKAYRQLFTSPSLFFQNIPKYCAVGLFRLREYGTVEFRMFDGTTDGEDLIRWCTLLQGIRDKALNSTIKSLQDRKTTEGLRTLLTQDFNVSDESLEEGIRMANDIFSKRMTAEELLSFHVSLFPEEAPLQIVKGQFGRLALAAYQEGTLDSLLRNFSRENFLEAYGDVSQPLYALFTEVSSENPIAAADMVVAVSQAFRL